MIILCADDYGIAPGVDRAIDALAEAGRLSATSALVTLPEWPDTARRLRQLRGRIAIGLHLNLTLGSALGPMPATAPEGTLPTIGQLTARAWTGRLSKNEFRAEIDRQLDRFESEMGYQPDHIDGHQHAHALPVVRSVLAAAARERSWPSPPLIRSPEDNPLRISRRGIATGKAIAIALVTAGARRTWRAAGFLTNDSFAGVSAFSSETSFAHELAAALTHPGPIHLVMCHPGFPDATLASRDPVLARREEEYDAITAAPDLPSRLWHPKRASDGPPVNWTTPA
ncbi:MAG: ChbG/HpnK family deacetylase [Hyphomicrobiaceae bacterium]|nr:ChbG/HpnK family deacetylase [Hyphomicrobiaceae bacterium]